ncbi:hypothetical protein ACM66B_000668 [Microbotryomycetes sp. NB124-2]
MQRQPLRQLENVDDVLTGCMPVLRAGADADERVCLAKMRGWQLLTKHEQQLYKDPVNQQIAKTVGDQLRWLDEVELDASRQANPDAAPRDALDAFERLGNQIENLGKDLRKEMTTLRQDLSKEMTTLRKDLSKEMQDLQTEVTDSFTRQRLMIDRATTWDRNWKLAFANQTGLRFVCNDGGDSAPADLPDVLSTSCLMSFFWSGCVSTVKTCSVGTFVSPKNKDSNIVSS